MIMAKVTAATPPTRNASTKGVPWNHRMRVTSAPMPKNAAWPRLVCPAKPPSMFQLCPMAIPRAMRKNRFHMFSLPISWGNTTANDKQGDDRRRA